MNLLLMNLLSPLNLKRAAGWMEGFGNAAAAGFGGIGKVPLTPNRKDMYV